MICFYGGVDMYSSVYLASLGKMNFLVLLTEPLPSLCRHMWLLKAATSQDEPEPTSSSIRAASGIAALRRVRNLQKVLLKSNCYARRKDAGWQVKPKKFNIFHIMPK